MDKNQAQPALESPKTAQELLDMYFLDMRSALLETAAALDRIERAYKGEETFEDARIRKLFAATDIIKQEKLHRAEKFLTLFSDPDL